MEMTNNSQKTKRKNSITLKKSDFNRVVLTDVLPYELPFILTNEGFYGYLNGKSQKNIIIEKILNQENITNPLVYTINKGQTSSRKLYLIHPSNQLSFCNFYRDYKLLITHLCNRSSYSLRYANSIATTYYEKSYSRPHKDYKDEGVECFDEESTLRYASSFFKYKNYDFLYKFYDGYEFHRIEKKFYHLHKFDISKCFDSLSTGMLIKALRGEKNKKELRNSYSFETEFIKRIENCNNGRDHGIVIGPEFSRIFSEIVLQSIDINIKVELESKNIYEGKDYDLKRYVDDFFLFYNKPNLKIIIMEVISEKLEDFKFYLNNSKSLDFTIPFITPITSAKKSIQDELNNIFDIFDCQDDINPQSEMPQQEEPHHNLNIIKSLNRYNLISNRSIRDIKCIIKENNVEYAGVTGYFFTLIKIKVADMDSKYSSKVIDNIQSERLCRFLLIILELAFFVYDMDLRVRSTYLISQIIIITNRLSNRLNNEQKERIAKKIHDESQSSIKKSIATDSHNQVEMLNLIIALSAISEDYKLEQETLIELLGFNNGSTNYFKLMVGLFYIKNNLKYRKSKLLITNEIIKIIAEKPIQDDSEALHLFLDSMSCPFISNRKKEDIFNNGIRLINLANERDISSLRDFLLTDGKYWFIDWRKSAQGHIEKLLLKKELRTPYGS
ncbi:antiviral reverse transcriptase Drt3b [Shewanella baltica]|uniref:antiviral reverse transcriptase Drt3b n=1 Tax=Shewanella baltica TaxID=62322 RepID=UPI0039AFDF5A